MSHLTRGRLSDVTITFLGDKLILMRAMRDHLREQGINDIHMVQDMGQAMTKMRSHGPDVVVVDLDNEASEAMGIMGRIRNDDHLFQVPIIALTGNASKDVVMKIARAGASDVIVKPFALKKLHERVLVAIDRTD